jgi:hypothetical protein
MSKYTSFESYSEVPDISSTYKLDDDLVWHMGFLNGPSVTIPKDFVFEVTIPKWAYWVFPFFIPLFNWARSNQAFVLASCVHDWFLETGADKLVSAGEFRRALSARLKENRWTIWPAFFAVFIVTVPKTKDK